MTGQRSDGDAHVPHRWLRRRRKGPRTKGSGRLLEVGKGRETHFPLELPGGTSSADILIPAPFLSPRTVR